MNQAQWQLVPRWANRVIEMGHIVQCVDEASTWNCDSHNGGLVMVVKQYKTT